MNSMQIGKYSFWAGIILAIVIALWPEPAEWAPWLLIVLGLVGGYVRVSEESESHFFIMTIALALFYNVLLDLPTLGLFLTDVFASIVTFLGAAVVAVVFRNILGWFR
ncbi:MAG: hypothetical protein O3B43_04725 [Chloroflexi bacterium]|nr:hypothetical protein [Chloroflexota bacterium]